MLTDVLRGLYKAGMSARFWVDGPVLSDDSAPQLSYAGLCHPSRRPSHGGNVKLIALNNLYPDAGRKCNLLYLVSSGLSVRAETWADACLSRGIKLVWNQNGVAFPAWAPRDHARLNSRMARYLGRASFVVYQSEFCRKHADLALGKCTGPGTVIYNAVDTGLFVPLERVSALPGAPLRLLVAGSHENPGRVMAALETLAILKREKFPVRLMIVGRLAWAGAFDAVKARARELCLEDAVELRGPYSREEAPAVYRSADILLHLKYADPCPSVVIEAMACGLPVAGSHSGGMPELVLEDGLAGGILVPVPQDLEKLHIPPVEAVADAVKRIYGDIAVFSAAARRRAVEKFDVSLWLARHAEVFRQVLSQ